VSKVIGYTTGVFDLFHIGHLNILRGARTQCDELIVGVTTDDLTERLKGRKPIVPFDERIEIVRSIRCVDRACAEVTDDKIDAWQQLRYDVIFKGDDWKGSPKWDELEERFRSLGVRVIYFPYTRSTSSSLIREIVETFDAR
jgi:glycerol-3-phosphate cytidylyltransferase